MSAAFAEAKELMASNWKIDHVTECELYTREGESKTVSAETWWLMRAIDAGLKMALSDEP